MIGFAALAAITIVASGDALTVPPQAPAGFTTITFQNTASEPHAIRIVEIRDRHTTDDFAAFLKSGGAPPAWVRTVGGVAAVAPNVAEEYSTVLPAGRYVVLDGDRFAPLTMVAGGAAATPVEAADIEVRLHDHGFQFSAPVEGPKPLWHLRNTGTEPHQAVLFRLTDGMTEYAARNWMTNGAHGPAPGDPRGGVLEVPINGEAWFRVDLPPGRYVLLCGELEQEGRHFDLGMVYRFTVE
ncbi:MAG TPA: hypothetical protein VFB07_05725 [Vicinamibacterales bacterium]|nr:hypothetical protein [Vicinamibacterales bacterium]